MKWREDKAENATIRKMWRDFRERPFVKMLIEESARKRANNMRDHPVVERLEQTGEPWRPKFEPEDNPEYIKCACCGKLVYEGHTEHGYCPNCCLSLYHRRKKLIQANFTDTEQKIMDECEEVDF